MGSNEIYTIGREFGSLGKQVGQDLAKRLGIKFYDKELLQKAAKESGLCEEIFESHDEKPTNSFLYSLVMDTYTGGSYAAELRRCPHAHRPVDGYGGGCLPAAARR